MEYHPGAFVQRTRHKNKPVQWMTGVSPIWSNWTAIEAYSCKYSTIDSGIVGPWSGSRQAMYCREKQGPASVSGWERETGKHKQLTRAQTERQVWITTAAAKGLHCSAVPNRKAFGILPSSFNRAPLLCVLCRTNRPTLHCAAFVFELINRTSGAERIKNRRRLKRHAISLAWVT